MKKSLKLLLFIAILMFLLSACNLGVKAPPDDAAATLNPLYTAAAQTLEAMSHEADEGRGDEKLVGRRVEQLAEHRHHPFPAGQPTVQPIGDRSEGEDGAGDGVAALEVREHDGDHGRDGHNPRQAQVVGEIHAPECTLACRRCQTPVPVSCRMRVISAFYCKNRGAPV